MEHWEIQPWLFVVEPYEGESLSHFLGRFRRENDLTPAGLGREAGIGAVVSRWEKFRLIPASVAAGVGEVGAGGAGGCRTITSDVAA